MLVKEFRDYLCNIIGIPGQYAVKAHGNNRIMVRDLPTIEAAEEWIKENRPLCSWRDVSCDLTPEEFGVFVDFLKREGAVIKCTR